MQELEMRTIYDVDRAWFSARCVEYYGALGTYEAVRDRFETRDRLVVSKSTIKRYLADSGVEILTSPERVRRENDAWEHRVKERYNRCRSMRQVAREFDCSTARIATILGKDYKRSPETERTTIGRDYAMKIIDDREHVLGYQGALECALRFYTASEKH